MLDSPGFAVFANVSSKLGLWLITREKNQLPLGDGSWLKKGGDKKEGDNMRLKDIREDLDITQKELAARLHIGQNTYSQYENGQRGLPIEVLMQLTVIFDTSADYILGLTDERRPYPRSERMTL